MHRNKSANVHQFAMVPRADIPRSRFRMQHAHKTTFDSGYLIPIYHEEVLPGDTFNLNMTLFARMATPIFPVMDNLYIDSFFFFVPNRLLWFHWQQFMGEQFLPDDPIDFTIPQIVSPAGGYDPLTIFDYFGLPTVGQVQGASTVTHSALPLVAYNYIWNQWFRDENLQDSVAEDKDDGPHPYTNYTLLKRGKRHDYFTSALPWPQKGNTAVSLPLGSSAPIIPNVTGGFNDGPVFQNTDGSHIFGGIQVDNLASVGEVHVANNLAGGPHSMRWNQSGLVADLSAATAATINQLRQAFQIQKLLERDARGGTRYTEILRAHFGVVSPDARLQRPEYLGGGSTPINITPVPQTSATDATSPQGNLASFGTVVSRHGFSQSFTEHGIIIGLVSVRADLTYQQGLRRHWSRLTRYDFYFPAFAMLGEQAILNKEIWCYGSGGDGLDDAVFGYQERWAEYRYHPSEITGLFRSTTTGATPNIDEWHLAQYFVSRPVLNDEFIQETPPMTRVLAVGTDAAGQEFICDSFFDCVAARPMPMYSVPGMIDHF